MEAFIALCTRRIYGEEEVVKPESPQNSTTKYYDCANFACACYANNEEVKHWPTASINGVLYRFCSYECWSEWANDPSHIACWSPQERANDNEKEIPNLDLNE